MPLLFSTVEGRQMNPTKISGANLALTAPSSWDAEKLGVECETLHVRRSVVVGAPCLQSAWLPTPEEIAAIVAGRPITLTVWSFEHPPVSLHIEP